MNGEWFKDHLAYTLSKYGMSECVLGMAEEFREEGIAVNALWPRTVIRTAALNMLVGTPLAKHLTIENCREPRIVADAAHAILTQSSETCTGQFYIDEQVLQATGISRRPQRVVQLGKFLGQ